MNQSARCQTEFDGIPDFKLPSDDFPLRGVESIADALKSCQSDEPQVFIAVHELVEQRLIL